MMPGLRFAYLRTVVLVLAVLAQIYLFFRGRRAIRSSRLSEGLQSLAISFLGMAIVLLFGLNLYIMLYPIDWIDPSVAAQISIFYPPAIWGLGSIFSALLLFLSQLGSRLSRIFFAFSNKVPGPTKTASFGKSRRVFLKAGAGSLFAGPLLIAGYGAAYGATDYEVQSVTLPFGQPLLVVQLSDIHAGVFMNQREIRRYADRVQALKPDLFVITGDFISNSVSFLPGCLAEMARVKAPYGTFATLGNHEHWYGENGEIAAIFRHHGIQLLQNSHRLIRTPGGEFAVAGIDDLMNGHPDLERALQGLDSRTPTLLLSHHPEIFPQAAARGIALTLAGHYHGGQIKLKFPGGGISLAHLRTPYPEGLYRIEASRLYVNRGIGTTFTPIRLNALPEITLFNLTSESV